MIWDFDPVAFSIAGLDVRWYGIAYVVGFFLSLVWTRKFLDIPKSETEDLIFGLFIAGIIGGRLGEFLFYNPEILASDPLEVLKIWNGGMSIHGGILGAFLWGLWWTRRRKISLLLVGDVISIPLAISLGLGRIANFLNG